jgi:sugar-specific transcriptional regulator TrmB
MASLSDLGLSEYEASVYTALLDAGPATAKELSENSEVPMGRIYDVLNGLESQHLVRSQTASRPKKYLAVEPDAALDRLLDEKKRELDERADQYEQVVAQLKRELDAPEAVGDDGFWTAALGPEEVLTLLLERLDAADDRVVMIASTPGSGLDLSAVSDQVADRLEAAVERGVTVEFLVSEELAYAVSRRVGERYGDLAERAGFALRMSDEVRGSFTIIDGFEVCIQVPNPVDDTEPFALIDLKDSSFAGDAYDTVRPKWEDATPL